MTPPLTLAQAHVVKCWPEFFAAVIDGRKRFEIRRNDRNYQTGDSITLREWEPGTSRYSGREASFTIGYITQFDQREGYVVFALLPAVPQPCSHPSVDDGECNLCDQPVPQEPQAQEPPADAKEWTCPTCGGDLLWCKCPKPAPSPLSAEALERRIARIASRACTGQQGESQIEYEIEELLKDALAAAPAQGQTLDVNALREAFDAGFWAWPNANEPERIALREAWIMRCVAAQGQTERLR